MSTGPEIHMHEFDREAVVGYEQLYRLAAGRIPNFSLLERLDVSSEGAVCSDDDRVIREQLDPIRDLCLARHWYPLITEFALISDIRREEAPQRNFTSFVRLSLPNSHVVAPHYLEALRHMKSEEASHTQIVPHPQLFYKSMGLIRVECAQLYHSKCSPFTEDIAKISVDYITATRENYTLHSELEGAVLPSVTTQARRFIQTFLQNVHRHHALAEPAQLLQASTVLILPFVRPPTKTTDPLLRGEPGGALFLFLAPLDAAEPLEELGRDLAWVLAEARDQQSDASLEAEIEERRAYRELIRVFGHGVTNQLKAAGLAGLRQRAARRATVPSREVLTVLDLLWPVWGVGDLSRIATMKPGQLRIEWLAPSLQHQLDSEGYLTTEDEPDSDQRDTMIRAIVLARLAALCAAQGDPGGEQYRFSWNGQPIDSKQLSSIKAVPLWPFHDNQFMAGTTLVTLGLFELLANSMKYLAGSGLPPNERRLDFSSTIGGDGVITVHLQQAAGTGDWQQKLRNPDVGPESRTINEIRSTVESKLRSQRGTIAETTQFTVDPDEPRVNATWTFAWRPIQWKAPRV